MKQAQIMGIIVLLVLCVVSLAQQPVATNTNVAVPPLVNFSGTLTDSVSRPMTGTVGVTFLLYKDQQGGAPLWMETQNVQPDSRGHYTVMLGSTSSTGLPADIFVAGQAHWLAVQVVGQAEQPRVLLVSTPYALKAGDAQTLGGLPPSAFVQTAAGVAPSDHPVVPGTITGVTAGTDLTGGGTSGNVTLNLNTSKVPTLSANNTFTGTQTIKNITTITGSNSTGVLQVTNTATTGTAAGVNATTDSTGASALRGNAVATSGTSNGVLGNTSSPGGYGVQGQQLASTSQSAGVFGSNANNAAGYGVEGQGFVGVYGVSTGTGGGVTGYGGTDGAFGVYGVSGSPVGSWLGIAAGVWGNSSSGLSAGVYGTADDAYGGVFFNNSSSMPTLWISNVTSGGLLLAQGSSGQCTIDSSANLACTGTVTSVVTPKRGQRRVSLYSVQSAENWFEDAGSGQLANGVARIELDPTFAGTVNTGVDYHVFLTPNEDCKGLYVSRKTATGFEVRELAGGSSNIAFDYRIMAKRNGYEKNRLQDVTKRYQQLQQQQPQRRVRVAQMHATQSP